MTHFSYMQKKALLTPETFPYAYSKSFSLTIKISCQVNTPFVFCINRVQIKHAVTQKNISFLLLASPHQHVYLSTPTFIHHKFTNLTIHHLSVRLIILLLSYFVILYRVALIKRLTVYVIIK